MPEGQAVTLASDNVPYAAMLRQLKDKFTAMMRRLHAAHEGAHLEISLLEEPETQDFITTHASILDSGFSQTTMSDAMRASLQRSDYIFSGIKTFHELNEAFPSLIDENGNRKPFEQFLNDVRSVDSTYNENYLRAEYNFCQQSANMASKWEQFMEDGDHYNLQYRTAGDDHVRPAHAALDRITLPPSHPFWQRYFPPNGWNCRCTVVQVRKSKYPETPDSEVEHLIEQNDTSNPKEDMFRFNPGMEQKAVPDYNAYTIRRCLDCPIAKGESSTGPLNLSRPSIPDNELCQACKLLHQIKEEKLSPTVTRAKIREAQKELTVWYKQSLPEVMVGKFPAKRITANASDGMEIIFNKNFYEEMISHYQDDPYYPLRLGYARNAHEIIKISTVKDPDEHQKHHPDSHFKVYEYTDDCYRVEMKVKCNRDGNIMRYLRVYKK